MLLTTNIKIKSKNRTKLKILKRLTRSSKDLYNKALYRVRQHFFKTKEYLSYKKAYHILKEESEYRNLPSNASQQTLKQVDNSFKSFFQLLKKKNQNSLKNRVHIPRYLDKEGEYKVVYTKIHLKVLDNGYIRLSLPKNLKKEEKIDYLYFKIPKHILGKEIKEVHILPYKFDYKISFIYNEFENSNPYKTDDIMAIDLGVNNLATIITRYNRPIIVDGKSLKSKNRYFNKKISVLQSTITKGKKDLKNIDKSIFKRLSIWYSRRDNYIKNFLHKSAKRIIDIALTRGIKKIVIG